MFRSVLKQNSRLVTSSMPCQRKNPLPRRCQQQALMMPAIVTTLKTIRITSNITTLDASEIWQSPVEIIFVEPVVQVLG